MGAAEAERRIDAQQPLGRRAAARHLALHFLDLAEDALRVAQVDLALGGEADAARGAVE
ncbi:hypothetical protein D3C87_2132870 [compost metagenome]